MKFLLKIIFAAILVIGSNSAYACGVLDKSDPKVGEILTKAPEKVTVWLTVPIDLTKSGIEVRNAEGKLVSTGNSTGDPEAPEAISINLKNLIPGKYKVTWHMAAASCGHISKGTFPFTYQP